MPEAAVVMHVKLPEGVSPEDDLAMLDDFVVPLAKAQAGFKNGTWARDGKGHGMGVIVFDTAENAAAAQDALRPPAAGGVELISSDLYEVGAQAWVSQPCRGLEGSVSTHRAGGSFSTTSRIDDFRVSQSAWSTKTPASARAAAAPGGATSPGS
jgi:hypothetical protein